MNNPAAGAEPPAVPAEDPATEAWAARLPEACAHLATAHPPFGALIARVGPCQLRPHATREPYEALIRAIAYQQLHGRAAEAILARLLAHHPAGFPAPAAVLAMDDTTLRACGFSASKIAALRDIAAGAASGLVPTRAGAAALSDEALIARLTTLRGVGRWTVEMLLIFTLGRPDVLPVDDFGVREGWRLLMGLAEQPRPRALAAIGRAWSPWRSIASWYLWRAADKTKKVKPSELTA
ncbi:MAG TPA: DNA-3-methyladenine glycosylase 2 family protein [Acetobacteraceae bacterium]|nr:DNA-3-methyladenine glycosylase 2 family protein [Acetobacteraceae bacterium]